MTAARPITRILVANRGEIARRIIRTCRALRIESVAVFTDPDRSAPHVGEATCAHALGAPHSYLSVDAIVAAATASGADAVHPGYGFLSENPLLPEALSAAGIQFIGPTAHTIRQLGSKTAAKQLAHQASVVVSPTLLLTTSDLSSQAEEIRNFAQTTGFPLILKAAAGGGGRGMRVLHADSDIGAELASARREALKAFSSEEVFVERYIAPARHIEVQIVGDTHGNVLALGTRDCSLQRSNQKIIEEAPAPNLPSETDAQLCAAAVRLAQAARYSSLGTVEFLYAPDGAFYFLEVNTRLQVEHPVTEAVTGLDLVALQIRLAQGESLSACGVHAQPIPLGHAIEARICAEDFVNGSFVLSTGTVRELILPTEPLAGTTVRNDIGITEGSVVSHHYDSLLGKVIVHGATREEALAGLLHALAHTRISGLSTNRALLMHLLSTPEFLEVKHSVQGTKSLLPSTTDTENALRLAHAVAAGLRVSTAQSDWVAHSPWLDTTRMQPTPYPWTTRTANATISSRTVRIGQTVRVSLLSAEDLSSQELQSHELTIRDLRMNDSDTITAKVTIDGDPASDVALTREGPTLWIHLPHGSWALQEFNVKCGGATNTTSDSGSHVTAHIPGRVAAVHVAAGEAVQEGTTLLILDSMKMEHPIRSPCTGTVSSIEVRPDQLVQSGAILIVIDIRRAG